MSTSKKVVVLVIALLLISGLIYGAEQWKKKMKTYKPAK